MYEVDMKDLKGYIKGNFHCIKTIEDANSFNLGYLSALTHYSVLTDDEYIILKDVNDKLYNKKKVMIMPSEQEHLKWLKNYLYRLYKNDAITSDQLYDISEIFSIKDDYEYARNKSNTRLY